MAYYDALKAVWGTLSSNTTEDKLAEVNAMMVDGPRKDIALNDLAGYLAGVLKLPSLMAYAKGDITQTPIAAAATLFSLRDFGVTVLQTSLPDRFTLVQQLLGLIVADKASGLNQDDADAIMAMTVGPQIPWWKANRYVRAFDPGDIAEAGLS